MFSLKSKLIAEFLGSALLLMIVIGSGIMGESLAGGNDAIALLGNTISTGAGLVVLISCLGPISGAHFNPIVTMIMRMRGELNNKETALYIIMQILGMIIGVYICHYIFGQNIIQTSSKIRDGIPLMASEIIASFGLLMTILLGIKFNKNKIPMLVGLYITSAYWFTSSTSFANPAITIARSLSDTFAGIAPQSVLPFIIAQIIGALLAHYVCINLVESSK